MVKVVSNYTYGCNIVIIWWPTFQFHMTWILKLTAVKRPNLCLYTWIESVVTKIRLFKQILITFRTFFNANDAVWPPRTSLTSILFRCILRMEVDIKWPTGSGPNNNVSFTRTTPFNVIPETTTPTPCKKNLKLDLLLNIYGKKICKY